MAPRLTVRVPTAPGPRRATTIRSLMDKQPVVRKRWLIAMAIVFVALMAIVFTMCNTGHVGT